MNVELPNDLIIMKRDIQMTCLHCVFFRREGHLESKYCDKCMIFQCFYSLKRTLLQFSFWDEL